MEKSSKNIQQLLAANDLLAILNLLDSNNQLTNIIMLKANVNRLKREKESLNPERYQANFNKLKQEVSKVAGVAYQPEKLEREVKLFPEEQAENSKMIVDIKEKLAAKLQQIPDETAIILQARFRHLLQQRNLGTILESHLKIELERIVNALKKG